MMNRYLLLLLALCSPVSMATRPFTVDLSAGLSRDDNITNGKNSKDVEQDSQFNVAATARYTIATSDISNLAISGRLALQQYRAFDKLNNTDLSLLLSYQVQPDRAYTSPWYMLSARSGSRQYDSDLRDNRYYEIILGLGKRLTDRSTLRAGLGKFSSNADNAIFDMDYSRLYVNLDLKLQQKNIVYGTLSYYRGDVISTNTPLHPTELNSIPWIDDDAYPGLSNPWTYRLDANTLVLQLGDNYVMSSQQSIDASISYYDSDAGNNFTYNRSILQLNYLLRF